MFSYLGFSYVSHAALWLMLTLAAINGNKPYPSTVTIMGTNSNNNCNLIVTEIFVTETLG